MAVHDLPGGELDDGAAPARARLDPEEVARHPGELRLPPITLERGLGGDRLGHDRHALGAGGLEGVALDRVEKNPARSVHGYTSPCNTVITRYDECV